MQSRRHPLPAPPAQPGTGHQHERSHRLRLPSSAIVHSAYSLSVPAIQGGFGPRPGASAMDSPADLPILRSPRLMLRQPTAADTAARVAVPRDPEEHRMYGGSGKPKPLSVAEIAAHFPDEYERQDLTVTRRFIIAARVWPD